MRNLLALLISFFSFHISAQEFAFVDPKTSELTVNPIVEKALLSKIDSHVKQKVEKIIKSEILDNEHITSLTDYSKDLEFITDTIRLNTFVEHAYKDYSIGSTIDMNALSSYTSTYTEKLLDKYYLKAQGVLKPKPKNELIELQQLWNDFKDKQLLMLAQLNNNGGTISYIYGEQWRNQFLLDRIIFLKDIYVGKFIGEGVYK